MFPVLVALFGVWQQVTPATVTQPVPIYEYVGATGSVQRYEKAEVVGCAIHEGGKVVGWSLGCNTTQKFSSVTVGGIRQ